MEYRIKKYFFLALALLAVAGCRKKAQIEIPLGVNNTEIHLKSNAEGWCNIPVYSTVQWTAVLEPECSWAGISPTSGQGYTEIRFEYDANLEGSPRNIVLFVSGGGYERRILITQPAN